VQDFMDTEDRGQAEVVSVVSFAVLG